MNKEPETQPFEKKAPDRQRYHCDFGIRSIQKGKKGKPATMTVEISNDLADKLMKAVTGIGPRIYGPVIEWEEDQNTQPPSTT